MVVWLLLLQLAGSSGIIFQRNVTGSLQSGLIEYIVAKILVVVHQCKLFCCSDHYVPERCTCSVACYLLKNKACHKVRISCGFRYLCSSVTYFGFLES